MPALQLASLGSLIERWLPSAGLAAALLICIANPALAAALAPWPFLIAAVAFGLPHGAADGVILLRGLSWPGRIVRIAAYVVLMALGAAALVTFPAVTLIAFLALSWWHFGAADGRGLSRDQTPAWFRLAWGFGRGGLAVSVPFAVDPAAAWAPFARLASLLGASVPVEATLFSHAAAAASGAAVLALLICAAAPRQVQPRAFEWIESALILSIGLQADPLLAVGCYFLLIHGFRQSATLGKELRVGGGWSLWQRLAVLHRSALPLLVPSWLVFASLVLVTQPAGIRDLAILSLALYVVATPPHHLFHEILQP